MTSLHLKILIFGLLNAFNKLNFPLCLKTLPVAKHHAYTRELVSRSCFITQIPIKTKEKLSEIKGDDSPNIILKS